ncbi:TetR/AcrR family transcriptional regulator [Pseudaminobacter arsenicus]|uniref:TetR/AcrR family transcriptional regulator n=1 Tax=Borborobacter arsenicus TaxID=1851146 RepID=A0A432VBA5_9HYPH|nr:TetR/AcrR family transcriptional regulator [Pseudaminobacter arsenicus]RUM99414.1 TetR/AcrR family transcriptional regulator [Pseudaminobacter arsenicus]
MSDGVTVKKAVRSKADSAGRSKETASRRAHNRLPQLLDQAAQVFAKHGYAAASVRDIVRPIGMLPGSLYYHFQTKEDLLAAVYREGVQRISANVDAAIEAADGPWQRLEAACVAHLSSVLDRTDYSSVVIRIRPSDAPDAAAELSVLRNAYEARFDKLVAELPLDASVNRRDLRLLLMGAMNWSQTWYREGGELEPEEIARRFVGLLKLNSIENKGGS